MPQAIPAIASWIGSTVAGWASAMGAGFVASAAYGAVAYYASYIALNVALAYGISEATRPKSERPQGGEVDLQMDADYPRQMVIGERGIGGSVVAHYSTGGGDNNNLHLVYALADHPCHSLTQVFADGRLVQGSLAHGVRTVVTAYSISGGPRVWMTFWDGRPGQTADTNLITVSALDGDVIAGKKEGWTSNHVGAGVCYIHIELQWDSDILTSIPKFIFQLKGAPLYDRRLDTTAGGSGSHRLDDPTTWAWTDNPMVALDHYLLGYQVEEETIAFGVGLLPEEVPYDVFAAAADLADEDVETGVGGAVETIKRYRANGVIGAEATYEEIIEVLQLQMAARVVDLGGRIGFLGSEERTPVVHLTDADLCSDETLQFSEKLPFDELIGAVEGRFCDPANLWQPTDYVRQVANGMVFADGGEAQTKTIEFPFEIHPRRSVRLASAYLERESKQPRLIAAFMPAAWKLEAGDWFTFTSDILQFADEPFEVIDILKHADFTVNITARAVNPNFTAYDNDNDPDLSVPPDFDPAILILDVPEFDVEDGTVTAGSVVEPCIVFTLTSDETIAREIVIEYGVPDPAWDPMTDPQEDALIGPSFVSSMHVSQILTKIRSGVMPSTDYLVRAKAKAGLRESLWSDWAAAITMGSAYAVGSAASVPWSGVTDDDSNRPADNADVTAANTAAAIASQGALATQNSAAWSSQVSSRPANLSALGGSEPIQNALVAMGPNAVVDTGFNLPSLYWVSQGYLVTPVATYVTESGLRKGRLTVTGSAANTSTAMLLPRAGGRLAVAVGDRVEASIYAGASLWSHAQIYVAWYTSAGVYVSATYIAQAALSGYAGTGDITTMVRLGGFATAPATAAFAAIYAFGVNSTGAGITSPVASFALPFLRKADATQTALSPWGPGFEAQVAADVTLSNTAAAITGQGTLATISRPNVVALTGSETIQNTLLPTTGANILRNTQFLLGTTGITGWVTRNNGSSTARTIARAGSSPDYTLSIVCSGSDSSQSYLLSFGTNGAVGDYFPVTPGSTIAVGVRLRSFSGVVTYVQPRIECRKADGTASTTQFPTMSTFTDAPNLADAVDEMCWRYVTLPSDCNWVSLEIFAFKASAGSTGAGACTVDRPVIMRIPAGQTVAPTWQPGADASVGADITSANTAAAIASQGDLATTNRATLPFGANTIINSEFAGATPFAWGTNGLAWNGNSGLSITRTTVTGARKAFCAAAAGTPSAATVLDVASMAVAYSGQSAARIAMPCVAGDVIGVSALMGGLNLTSCGVVIGWLDAAGASISETSVDFKANTADGSTADPATYQLHSGVATAPANTRFALVWGRGILNGTANPKVWLMSPLLCKLPAGQTAVPVYQPGPADRLADITSGNTAAAVTGQGALATLSAVGTSQISANAVTVGVVDETDASYTPTTSYADIADVTITVPDSDSLVKIDWSFFADGYNVDDGDGSEVYAEITRTESPSGSPTQIYETFAAGCYTSFAFFTTETGQMYVPSIHIGQVAGFDTDQPGAGTWIYKLRVKQTNTATWDVSKRRLFAMLFKR